MLPFCFKNDDLPDSVGPALSYTPKTTFISLFRWQYELIVIFIPEHSIGGMMRLMSASGKESLF